MKLNSPMVWQELWGMRITSSFPLLPGPLWHAVVRSGRVIYMGEIELKRVLKLN